MSVCCTFGHESHADQLESLFPVYSNNTFMLKNLIVLVLKVSTILIQGPDDQE